MKELVTNGVAYNEDEVEILSMKQKNGFPRKNPAVILNSICMVRSVTRVNGTA